MTTTSETMTWDEFREQDVAAWMEAHPADPACVFCEGRGSHAAPIGRGETLCMCRCRASRADDVELPPRPPSGDVIEGDGHGYDANTGVMHGRAT